MTIHVRVLSDSVESGAQLIKDVLIPGGFEAALKEQDMPNPDVILLDFTQLQGTSLDPLKELRNLGITAPAIILAAQMPIRLIQQLLKLNVYDFILKPYDKNDVAKSIRDACKRFGEQKTPPQNESPANFQNGPEAYDQKALAEIAMVGREVGALDNLDLVLERVLETAVNLLKAETGSLYIISPGTNQLILRAVWERDSKASVGTNLGAPDKSVLEVLQIGEAINQLKFKPVTSLVESGYIGQATLVVPIRMRKEVLGVISVTDPRAQTGFTDQQKNLIQILADWTSLPIQKSRAVTNLENRISQTTKHMRRAKTDEMEQQKVVNSPFDMRGELTSLHNDLTRWAREQANVLRPENKDTLDAISSRLTAMLTFSPADRTQDTPIVSGNIIESTWSVIKAHRAIADTRNVRIGADIDGIQVQSAVDLGKYRKLFETLLLKAIYRSTGGSVEVAIYRFKVFDGIPRAPLEFPADLKLDDGSWAAISISDSGATPSTLELRSLQELIPNPHRAHDPMSLTLGDLRLQAHEIAGELWFEQTGKGNIVTLALLEI